MKLEPLIVLYTLNDCVHFPLFEVVTIMILITYVLIIMFYEIYCIYCLKSAQYSPLFLIIFFFFFV